MYMEGHIFVHCCIYIPNVETFRVVGLKTTNKTGKKNPFLIHHFLQITFLGVFFILLLAQKSMRSWDFSSMTPLAEVLKREKFNLLKFGFKQRHQNSVFWDFLMALFLFYL